MDGELWRLHVSNVVLREQNVSTRGCGIEYSTHPYPSLPLFWYVIENNIALIVLETVSYHWAETLGEYTIP